MLLEGHLSGRIKNACLCVCIRCCWCVCRVQKEPGASRPHYASCICQFSLVMRFAASIVLLLLLLLLGFALLCVVVAFLLLSVALVSFN